jgi:hypothetical protein
MTATHTTKIAVAGRALRLAAAVAVGTSAWTAPLAATRTVCPVAVTPPELEGRLDPASRLAELAGTRLARLVGSPADPGRVGVFLSTRCGNHRSVHRFTAGLRDGRRSPATFSLSGYNICAQAAARGAGARGPSVVLAGLRASLPAAVVLAGARAAGGGVDRVLVGQVTWTDGPEPSGYCVLLALDAAPGPAGLVLDAAAACRPSDGPHGTEDTAALALLTALSGAPS